MRARHLQIFGFVSFCVLLSLYLNLQVLEHQGKSGNYTLFSHDFTAYYAAGELVREGKIRQVYDQDYIWHRVNELLHKDNPSEYYFLYPPFVAWACAPLTLVPRDTAALLFFCANLSVAFVLAFLLPRHFGLIPRHARVARWLFLGSLPLWATLFNGQNGNISLALLASIFLLHQQSRHFAAGLVLSATLYKPQLFAGIYLWMLFEGNPRLWKGFFLGASLLFLIGSLAGIDLWSKWWHSTQYVAGTASNPGALYSLRNLSGFWQGNGLPAGVSIFFNGLWLLLAALFTVALWRLPRGTLLPRGFALAIIASIVLSPRIYHYDLPLMFPALLLMARPHGGVALWLPVGLSLSFYLQDLALLMRVPLVPVLLAATLPYLSWNAIFPKRVPTAPPN